MSHIQECDMIHFRPAKESSPASCFGYQFPGLGDPLRVTSSYLRSSSESTRSFIDINLLLTDNTRYCQISIEDSYLAFNEFPSIQEPIWSRRIPIRPSKYDDWDIEWAVKLISIELFTGPFPHHSSDRRPYSNPVLKLNFHDQWSLLDTGTWQRGFTLHR